VTYEFYNVLHIVGIILVFMALGAALLHAGNGGTREQNPSRKPVAGLHGLGLLLILIAGFGMLAKRQLMVDGLPGWIHPKLLVWLLLGAAPALIMRKPGSVSVLWVVVPLLGAVAAYFGINHG
jgi:hypothetical protein